MQFRRFSRTFSADFPLKTGSWQAEFRNFQLRLSIVIGAGIARLVRLTNPTGPDRHFQDLFVEV